MISIAINIAAFLFLASLAVVVLYLIVLGIKLLIAEENVRDNFFTALGVLALIAIFAGAAIFKK